MASPYAAGVAALLSGAGLTNAQVMECIKLTSTGKGAFDPVFGYGIVDADAATSRCSPQTTPAYVPTATPMGGGGSGSTGSAPGAQPGGGSGSGSPSSPTTGPLELRATILRATRAQVARSGVVKVRVTANRAVRGRLSALVSRRSRRSARVGSGRFALDRAGSRTVRVKLTRSGRRLLRRPNATLRVKYVAPGARGYATPAR